MLKLCCNVNECKPLVGGRRARRRGDVQGKAVQVDPIKSTLKAPGTDRLKLYCDEPLSSFGFKSNLRRYTKGVTALIAAAEAGKCAAAVALCAAGMSPEHVNCHGKAVRVDPIKPKLNPPGRYRLIL